MSSNLSTNFNLIDPDMVSVIDELSLWSAPFGLKLLATVKLKKGINALDIGFGLGFPILELAQRLGNTSKVFGIDPWEKATDRVKLKITKYQIKNVELMNAVAEKIPFEDDYFELIVSNNGLNNVDDLETSLKECARVSKTKSQLVFTLNLEDSMIEFYSVFKIVLEEENLIKEISRMKEHIYSKRKPIDEIKELLQKTGYKNHRISYDKFSMKFIDGTSFLNHFFIRLAFYEPWAKILNEHDRERIFRIVEGKINTIAAEKGEFIITIPFATFDCERD